MEKKNVVLEKSYEFGREIMKLYVSMKRRGMGELGEQLFRCGTSVGANIAEAQDAQSRRDFVSKMQISLKEASVKSSILYPAQALTFHPFFALEKPHVATAMLRFSALKKNKIPTA